jgi:hypothetical protein
MAFSYSPKVVTDGLVLYLDAANPYSYVSGSTVWNDLSRSQLSGSLINGPTYNSANNGSIVFDGSNDYVDCGTTLSNQFGNFSGSLTLSVWFYPTSLTDNGILYFGTLVNNYGELSIDIRGQAFEVWTNRNNKLRTSALTANRWYQGTVTIDTSNAAASVVYVNGIATGSFSTPSGTIDFRTKQLVVGTYYSLSYPFKGNISTTQIYNRALSAQEVLQNYNATKGRFGLT